MINKFQTGGNIQQQLKQIFNALNTNPQETVQMLVKNGATPEQIMQIVEQGVRTNAVKPEVASAVQQMFSQKARHGAKLNYIKSLKNQCAEDEELYYYKKGGSVGCGCKKKEDGGFLTDMVKNAKKKANDAVQRFREKEGWHKTKNGAKYYIINKPKNTSETIDKSTKDYLEGRGYHNQGSDQFKKPKKEKGGKVKNEHSDLDVLANLKPKKACNGAVAKFKKKCGGKVKK